MDVGTSPMEGISTVGRIFKFCLLVIVAVGLLTGCASLKPMYKSEFKDINAAFANVVRVGKFTKTPVKKSTKLWARRAKKWRRSHIQRQFVRNRQQTKPQTITQTTPENLPSHYQYRFHLFRGLYRHYPHHYHYDGLYRYREHERTRESERTQYHHWRRHKVVHTEYHLNEVHLPKLEDGEGFIGRRPVVDPFRPGEDVVLNVSYFNVVAGQLSLKVLPYKTVNGKKAYDFAVSLKSNKIFSLFYSVDDRAETFVDFDTLTPITYTMDANESSQQKETRVFFDWNDDEATEWEKVIHPGDDHEKEKNIKWKLDSYSQNFISAIYYLRTFTLRPGKKIAFRVAGDGKNYVFDGDVLRREKLVTEAGTFNTLVVQPTFHLKGKFQATGDNYVWLTDDSRKLPVQIKLKIKIGSLMGRLARLDKGQ